MGGSGARLIPLGEDFTENVHQGGVIGIWPRHALVDGTITSQPEFSFWFLNVGWGVENYGTDPDIEVENKPQDYAAGRDAQLERSIQEVMKSMEKNPPQLPTLSART